MNIESELLQQRQKREQKRIQQLESISTPSLCEPLSVCNSSKQKQNVKEKRHCQNYALRKTKTSTMGQTNTATTTIAKLQARKCSTSSLSCQSKPSIQRKKIGDCHHNDIFDMVQMPKNEVKYYLEKDRFLENRKCVDCKNLFSAMVDKLSKNKFETGLVYFCNNAMKCFHAADNDVNKSCVQCNLVICCDCYWKREAKCTQRVSKRSRRS